MKNAQSWSIDLIIGVIIFMLVIAIFYALLSSKHSSVVPGLDDDARLVTAKLSGNDISSLGLIKDGIVNQERYDELCDMPYDELKAELGVENDFCIYFEDADGNVLPCGSSSPQRAGIGNGKDIIIGDNDIKCGSLIS